MPEHNSSNLSIPQTEEQRLAMLAALTVLIGRAQMLQRRLVKGTILPDNDALIGLESILRQAWIIERNLNCHGERDVVLSSKAAT